MTRTVLPALCLVVALATLAVAAAGPAAASPGGRPDWNRTDDPLLDAVGLHAGKVGGAGLAFKFPLRWWLYGQVAGGIWHTADDKRHNVGFELQYLLRQDSRLRLFVAGGLGYFYHKERVSAGGIETVSVSDALNTGFGLGVEWLHRQRFAVQGELDFTHEGDGGSIIVFPQVGIFYYF